MIRAVAIPGGGQSATVDAFRPEAVYQLTDKQVFIQLALPRGVKVEYPADGDKHQGAKRIKQNAPTNDPDLQWWEAQVIDGSLLGQDRPLGYNTFRLSKPRVEIHYYLWPARLFDRQQWLAMMADVERELGFQPWGDGSERVTVHHTRDGGSVTVEADLKRIEGEVRAAHGVLRNPYTEAWVTAIDGLRIPDLPENRLIARWFLRRQPHVDRLWRYLERRTAELGGQYAALMGNAERQRDIVRQQRAHQALTSRARRIRSQLARWRHDFGLTADDGGLAIGPAMLRDHRLRRLLAALRPRPDERLSDVLRDRSTLPPMRTPRFFELWGVVWLVSQLRDMGWRGPPPRCWGADGQFSVDGIHGARWHLTRGPVELEIDWEYPVRVQAPDAIIDRRCSALRSAAAKLAGADGDIIYSTRPNTPDYLFRFKGPDGRSLAIGDASMADPKFQKGRKISTIARYPREIGWLPEGSPHPITCAPLGLFLLLPGKHDMWSHLEDQSAACDCRLLIAAAGLSTAADRAPVESWIDYMVSQVSH